MNSPKYKLVRQGFLGLTGVKPWGKDYLPVYRIKALRDIPEYGIKAGELGGLVTSKFALAQSGEAWIGYDAQVFGNVYIMDTAYVGGDARVWCDVDGKHIIIRGLSKVTGNAQVFIEPDENGNPVRDTVILGGASITDNAVLHNVGLLNGEITVFDDVRLLGVAAIFGEVGFEGKVVVNKDTKIHGRSFFMQKTVISENCTIRNSTFEGSVMIFSGETVENVYVDSYGNRTDKDQVETLEITLDGTPKQPVENKSSNVSKSLTKGSQLTLTREAPAAVIPVTAETQAVIDDALLLLVELNGKHSDYETDIVKLIKYPVMADKSNPAVAELHVALGRANRMSLNPAHTGFVDAVTNAEKAFLAAESYALKMASTVFTDAEQKKVSKVNDLLSIASNDASTDHEKKVAFEQAFKQLEGVIAVPEIAMETFKVKIGLKEIEM